MCRRRDSNPHGQSPVVFETTLSTDSNTPAGGAVYVGRRLPSAVMGRLENRVFRLGDELSRLDTERELVEAELSYHRLIADDTLRDAVVSGTEGDRLEAGASAADVTRFERRLRQIDSRRAELEEKRRALLSRIGE